MSSPACLCLLVVLLWQVAIPVAEALVHVLRDNNFRIVWSALTILNQICPYIARLSKPQLRFGIQSFVSSGPF
jgi:hypothetical protein